MDESPARRDACSCRTGASAAKDKRKTSLAIDGRGMPALDRSLADFDWPQPGPVTMAKLFIVIGKR